MDVVEGEAPLGTKPEVIVAGYRIFGLRHREDVSE